MNRSTALCFVSLVLLAALTGACTRWSHPAKGQREYNSDTAICWREADESGETKYWPRRHVHDACMKERGWIEV